MRIQLANYILSRHQSQPDKYFFGDYPAEQAKTLAGHRLGDRADNYFLRNQRFLF